MGLSGYGNEVFGDVEYRVFIIQNDIVFEVVIWDEVVYVE